MRTKGQYRWYIAWRVGLMSFILLSIFAWVAGWILTMFAEENADLSVVDGAFNAVFGGIFVVFFASPITAVVSLLVAAIAWVVQGREARRR